MHISDTNLLIDGLYINSSGGLRLLEYLISELEKKGVAFYLLADSRCRGEFDNISKIEYLKASLYRRMMWYKRDLSVFSAVLCFGNIPVPRRLDIPVYTYFHNINLLTLNDLPSSKVLFKSWLKREVFRLYKSNTDYWLVQTSNTKAELIRHLKENENRVLLMPFFNLPDTLCNMSASPHGDDYVYVANYTGSKQHEALLSAWILLHERKIDKVLHLTVPESQVFFLNKVREAQKRGAKIVNHGFLPFEEVINLYAKSKAIIYPSLNESLGLGVVEAISAGCDVIGADLPYIHTICKPSEVFNPHSAESIAYAVIEYEKGKSKKSELTIHNMINGMINLFIMK